MSPPAVDASTGDAEDGGASDAASPEDSGAEDATAPIAIDCRTVTCPKVQVTDDSCYDPATETGACSSTGTIACPGESVPVFCDDDTDCPNATRCLHRRRDDHV